MNRAILTFFVIGLFSFSAFAGNWPTWRGPNGNGFADETGVPTQWSATENVTWKTPLPGPGNSSPIVWGEKVFITQANDDGSQRSLMCFARGDGKLLWTKTVAAPAKEPTHNTNPYGASSPVTDGQRVVVWHGSAGLHCYDLNGAEKWNVDLGTFTHIWGYASSPVIYGDLVILSAGPGLRAFLVAFNKETGREVWRNPLDGAQSEEAKQYRGSWGTPVPRKMGGRTEFVLGLPKQVIGFDPATGRTLWTCGGLSDLVYTNPIVSTDGSIVVAMCGYGGPAVAVEPTGEGDVSDKQLWRHPKNPQRIGTGMILGEHVYMLNEPGQFQVMHARTGEVVLKDELRRSWSSMAYVDGKLYMNDDRATTYIVDPDPKRLNILHKNAIGEKTNSSIAFSDGQLFIRTYQNLYCIGQRRLTPAEARLRDRRGDEHLKAGRMKEAIADFDAYLAVNPQHEPHHWRRGIAYYYAGEFEKGVKQFEVHKTVNGNDVENTVWHFLCNAKLRGVEAARSDLLPPDEADGRVPMMKVLELFAGKATADDVLATAKTDGPRRQQAESALFYAHLYIGLYHEATGNAEGARKHLLISASEHTSPHYMGDVARVHVKLRGWEPKAGDEAG